VPEPPRLLQRLAVRLLGTAAEQESREWMLVCPRCGHARSVWDLGGVRYKAASKGKRKRMRCPACGETGWHRVERHRPVQQQES
jgi:predicted RNA-binding Zn-ribbon protein involved in translation (DUF1610 family)